MRQEFASKSFMCELTPGSRDDQRDTRKRESQEKSIMSGQLELNPIGDPLNCADEGQKSQLFIPGSNPFLVDSWDASTPALLACSVVPPCFPVRESPQQGDLGRQGVQECPWVTPTWPRGYRQSPRESTARTLPPENTVP